MSSPLTQIWTPYSRLSDDGSGF